MTATLPRAADRVNVVQGWAVRDLPNGDQVRAHLIPDMNPIEPERGPGMWNEGVSIVELGGYFGHRGGMDQPDCMDGVHGAYVEPDWADDPETVARFLTIFRDVQHVQHERRDGLDILVIAEGIEDGANVAGIAQSTWDEWLAWADGDVWGAESEYRTLADAMDAEDFDEGWSEHDTLWGGYGDDGALSVLEQVLYVGHFGQDYAADLPAPYEVTSA